MSAGRQLLGVNMTTSSSQARLATLEEKLAAMSDIFKMVKDDHDLIIRIDANLKVVRSIVFSVVALICSTVVLAIVQLVITTQRG